MKESDLYPPVKQYLENQGFEVKGEVLDCDVVAKKEEMTVLVELKLSINLKLLFQAIHRKEVSDWTYVAVANNCPTLKKSYKDAIKLLKLLGIGLLVVHVKSDAVNCLLDPVEYKPRKNRKKANRLLHEFEHLIGDPNVGGTNKRKKMTVYRQKAIAIAGYLIEHGDTKASLVKDELGESKARDILYNNVYGWFEMQGKGVYSISPKGKKEYKQWVL